MMANDPRESDGYIIAERAQEALDVAARDYSFEVLVKARLIADGRGSETVTAGDISLAVQQVSGANDHAYFRISKRSIRRVLIAATGVVIGALAGYMMARNSSNRVDIFSAIAALSSTFLSLAASLMTWRVRPKRPDKANSLHPSETYRKMLLVDVWASIEREIYTSLQARSEGRDVRSLPLRAIIEEYARINKLGANFQKSVSDLTYARNRIVHSAKFDLPEEEYRSLMDTAKQVLNTVSSLNRGGGDEGATR